MTNCPEPADVDIDEGINSDDTTNTVDAVEDVSVLEDDKPLVEEIPNVQSVRKMPPVPPPPLSADSPFGQMPLASLAAVSATTTPASDALTSAGPQTLPPPPPAAAPAQQAPTGTLPNVIRRPRKRPTFTPSQTPRSESVLDRKDLLARSRDATGGPKLSSDRPIAGNLPEWSPLPPHETIFHRSKLTKS